MKFDWGSFLFGVCGGILILSLWQRRVDRLHQKTLRLAVEQYAKDIEDAESDK
jgi:hypothetical protein